MWVSPDSTTKPTAQTLVDDSARTESRCALPVPGFGTPLMTDQVVPFQRRTIRTSGSR